MQLKLNGISRAVLLIGPYAVKVPRIDNGWELVLNGLLANMQERKWARAGYDGICPITWGLPGGFLNVMRRARVMTDEEFRSFDVEAFCERREYRIPSEAKADSYGWLDGRIVALDYG